MLNIRRLCIVNEHKHTNTHTQIQTQIDIRLHINWIESNRVKILNSHSHLTYWNHTNTSSAFTHLNRFNRFNVYDWTTFDRKVNSYFGIHILTIKDTHPSNYILSPLWWWSKSNMDGWQWSSITIRWQSSLLDHNCSQLPFNRPHTP